MLERLEPKSFMASLTLPILTTNDPCSFSSSITPFTSLSKSTVSKARTTIRAICNATGDGQYHIDDDTSSKNGTETSQLKFDRRNLLLGIGGFFGASAFGADPSAFAAPLAPTFMNFKPTRRLDTTAVGYTHQPVDLPWLNFKPTPRREGNTLPSAPSAAEVFPATLQKPISVLVKRPKQSRTRKEKEEAEEVLEIFGIRYNTSEFVKFDVYVNEENPDESGPEWTEFVGSFVNVPHGYSMAGSRTSFALSRVLEDLGADEFESILVTLVPKRGAVAISGIKIEFDSRFA